MMTSPPRPPSPPDGPPRGTNFSRRKATQPLPPSPALTRIRASSINIAITNKCSPSDKPRHHRPQPSTLEMSLEKSGTGRVPDVRPDVHRPKTTGEALGKL